MQSLSAVQPACGHLRSSARKVSACAEPVDRRGVLLSLVAAAPVVAASAASAAPSEFASSASMDKLQRQGAYRLTEDEWKQKLTPGQFSILRNASTERPFANPLNSEKRNGALACAGSVCKLSHMELCYLLFSECLGSAFDLVPVLSLNMANGRRSRSWLCGARLENLAGFASMGTLVLAWPELLFGKSRGWGTGKSPVLSRDM